MEDIVAELYSRRYPEREMKKNPKSSDCDRIIRSKSRKKINSEADWEIHYNNKSYLAEMMIEYSSLIERENYLTFRGFEDLKDRDNKPHPYKNKYHYLYKNNIHIIAISKKKDKRWGVCFVKPSELTPIGISPRKDYGKGALKVKGFRQKLKDCKFLNEKSWQILTFMLR